jgi:aminodeoxyfutalosine deaminase
MRKIHATYLIDATGSIVRDKVVFLNDEGTIEAVKTFDEQVSEDTEHYEGLLCPGFINAHCHLELSYLKSKISPQKGLVSFISEVLKIRNDESPEAVEAMHDAEQEMIENGIVAVGDISNDTLSFYLKSKNNLRYHTFIECFGLNAQRANDYFFQSKKILDEACHKRLAASISPHAPYSMSDELFQKIFSFGDHHSKFFSFHNQESPEENKFFRGEKNEFEAFYKSFGFQLPRRRAATSLQANLPLFPKNKKLLLVHNTFSSKEDLEWATKEYPNLYFCFCPSANLYIEDALPSFKNFIPYESRLCIGTDSLASNDQLSLLNEMKIIQRHEPFISTQQLITWATKNAADFYEWNDLGSIELGKRPGFNLIIGLDHQFNFTEKSAIKRLL